MSEETNPPTATGELDDVHDEPDPKDGPGTTPPEDHARRRRATPRSRGARTNTHLIYAAAGALITFSTFRPWLTENSFNVSQLPGDPFVVVTRNAYQLGPHGATNPTGPMLGAIGVLMAIVALLRLAHVSARWLRGGLFVLLPACAGAVLYVQYSGLVRWTRDVTGGLNQGSISLGFLLCTLGVMIAVLCVPRIASVAPVAPHDVVVEARSSSAEPSEPSVEVRFQTNPPSERPGATRPRQRALSALVHAALIALASYNAAIGHYPVAFVIAAVLLIQSLIVTQRSLSLTGPLIDDPATQHRLAPLLIDLCRDSGRSVPRVAIQRSAITAGVVQTRAGVTLRISPDVLAASDDDALRAIIAHEFSHLQHDDLRAVRRRVRLNVLVPYVVGVAALFTLGHSSGPAFALFIVWFVPAMRITSAVTGFTHRSREYRADTDGANLVHDAEAMIRGLRVVTSLADGYRRTVFGPTRTRWLLWPFSMKPTTHPPLSARVRRLCALSPAGDANSTPS